MNLRHDASFIVRIWWERPVGSGPVWRGQVVHAKSGQARYFDRLDTLAAFVEQWTGELRWKASGERPPAVESVEREEDQDEAG